MKNNEYFTSRKIQTARHIDHISFESGLVTIAQEANMNLLVLTPDCADSARALQIRDQGWGLQEHVLEHEQSINNPNNDDAKFLCVSYSWGPGRVASPFHASFRVSDRTMPVLAATALQRPLARRIWVDAFCVPGPAHPVERAATLESMGFIYSRAEEVIAVLTASCLPVLSHLAANPKALLRNTDLDILEKEDWPIRAWTYQEAVNARRLRITCESAPEGVMIDCLQYFSHIGRALNDLSFEERARRYPRLDAFEDVMADCAVAAFMERSAVQVMAVMEGRVATWEDDHFYAMMGAISNEPAQSGRAGEGVSACEAFMRLCERKGDYSFIFSSAGRDSRKGYGWRPRPVLDTEAGQQLPAIIRLHSKGEGLFGKTREDSGLVEVENVFVLKKTARVIDDALQVFILRWLEGYYKPAAGMGFIDGSMSPQNSSKVQELAYAALRELGFTGSGDYISAGCGIVFPQSKIPEDAIDEAEILVASEIRWSLGSPALIRYPSTGSTDSGPSYVPGVFFGQLQNAEGQPENVTLF